MVETSNDPSSKGQQMDIVAVTSGSLVLSLAGSQKFALYNCISRIDSWTNSLGNGAGQDDVHQLVCDDDEGWRWYLSHGAPGLVEQPALGNRILPSFHTIRSASGYILHRAHAGGLPRDYALEPRS
jgi:hypothetical protein